VIAYFDTSAIIPLLISEPSTDHCTRLWNEASRIVGVRLIYPEACAALARAVRVQRLTSAQMSNATSDLDVLIQEIDHIEITDNLARAAGQLAQHHSLRGYDAVHLAAAVAVADRDVVLVTGDTDLAGAAAERGLATAVTSVPPA
jgi:predicted nucleic acid-binding protein